MWKYLRKLNRPSDSLTPAALAAAGPRQHTRRLTSVRRPLGTRLSVRGVQRRRVQERNCKQDAGQRPQIAGRGRHRAAAAANDRERCRWNSKRVG